MKTLDPFVFYAVLIEMMGAGLFWAMTFLALAGIVLFVWVLVRERGISSKRLVRSELIGLCGGFAALALMAYVTVSGFTDAGGPVDWLLVGVIWGAGLVGTTILSYALMGLISTARRQEES